MEYLEQKNLVDVLLHSEQDEKIFAGYICTVEVTNLVPPEYKVSITGIGSDFDYRDGTTFRDIDDPIIVGYGQVARTESNDATKCVKTVITAIRIKQEGFPPTALVHRFDAPSADQCVVRVPITLAPKETVTIDDLSAPIENILVLK